jgi:DNA-binding MarR family transcriptional regulator
MKNLSEFSTYRTGVLQATAYRNLRDFMAITLGPHSITSEEWSILGIVHEETKNGGIRVSALADILDVQTSFITNMVNKLQKQGYVLHKFDEDDARVRLIVGTDKAHLKVVEIESTLRKDMRMWLDDIDSEDVVTYIKVLTHIAGNSLK